MFEPKDTKVIKSFKDNVCSRRLDQKATWVVRAKIHRK